MATYLLDTDHVSYLQERNPAVLRRLISLSPDDQVLTSAVAIAELLRAVLWLPEGRRREELLALYLEAVREMGEVLPIPREKRGPSSAKNGNCSTVSPAP